MTGGDFSSAGDAVRVFTLMHDVLAAACPPGLPATQADPQLGAVAGLSAARPANESAGTGATAGVPGRQQQPGQAGTGVRLP